MELVYTNMNGFIVENARNILENANIETVIKNQYLSSGFGEISGIDSWPELWIKDGTRRVEAMELLKKAGIGTAEPEDEKGLAGWVCPNCSEEIEGQFTRCWNCNTERPQ